MELADYESPTIDISLLGIPTSDTNTVTGCHSGTNTYQLPVGNYGCELAGDKLLTIDITWLGTSP